MSYPKNPKSVDIGKPTEDHNAWSVPDRFMEPPPRPSVDDTLEQRGERYGEFPEHARITQNLKSAMADSPNWGTLPSDMKEAMEMVAHKFGRILNGDPEFHDSWHDCIGYLRLVEQRLNP